MHCPFRCSQVLLWNACVDSGSGEISHDEYLYWALRWAALNSGMATMLQKAFCKFDTSGNEELDLGEFSKAIAVRAFGRLFLPAAQAGVCPPWRACPASTHVSSTHAS